jgi:mortality factor 4-like protein 1
MASPAIGTKGWVMNGPLLYVARIMSISQEDGSFFIHFDGWKKRWDEYVDPHEFLEDSPENKALSLRLKEELKSKKAKAQAPKIKKTKNPKKEKIAKSAKTPSKRVKRSKREREVVR